MNTEAPMIWKNFAGEIQKIAQVVGSDLKYGPASVEFTKWGKRYIIKLEINEHKRDQ